VPGRHQRQTKFRGFGG